MSNLSPPNNSANEFDRQKLKGISLATRKCEGVQKLPSFKKSLHRIPDEVTSRTQTFVGNLGASRVRADLDQVFKSLRSAFRFKRTELVAQETDDGAGSIITPFFRYTSCVYQNPENASEVVWQRDIAEVTAPEQLLTDSFAEAFGLLFDTVEFIPTASINLEKLIDVIEELDDDRVSLDYDRQLTSCEIYIQGTNAKLQVTPEAFRIVHPEPTDPRILISSFFDVQDALVDFSKLS